MLPPLDTDSNVIKNSPPPLIVNQFLIIRSVAVIDVCFLKFLLVSYFSRKKLIKLSRFSKHANTSNICLKKHKVVIGVFLRFIRQHYSAFPCSQE